MSADPDVLHRQFLVQSAQSVIAAIDELITDTLRTRLSDTTKGHIDQILKAGFCRVIDGKDVRDAGQDAADAIWSVIDFVVYGEEDADVSVEDEGNLKRGISREVFRAFANFAEGIMNLADDELRRRERQG
jgi:hypothetical protein